MNSNYSSEAKTQKKSNFFFEGKIKRLNRFSVRLLRPSVHGIVVAGRQTHTHIHTCMHSAHMTKIKLLNRQKQLCVLLIYFVPKVSGSWEHSRFFGLVIKLHVE
jgi:hypothetical protein